MRIYNAVDFVRKIYVIVGLRSINLRLLVFGKLFYILDIRVKNGFFTRLVCLLHMPFLPVNII